MKSLDKEIERDYELRGWNRWLKNLVSETFGFVSLILWLTFIFGSLFAVWDFREPLWNGMAGLLTSK